MKQYFIESGNFMAHISEWGKEENPTIFCLHGLGSTSLSFLEVSEMLSDRYHILSIELPGHGKTPAFNSDEEYSVPNLLEWLSNVIESIKEGQFYLMCHSWGGCVGLHYAAKYPDKVKKVLLIDGGYHDKRFSYKNTIQI